MHPRLILMSGLPGSGKSTVASAVASSLGAIHLNSDIVRKELSSKGKYTDNDKALVYQVLMDACSRALAEGRTVIADATFTFQHWRKAFERMATLRAVPVYWVLMTSEDAVIQSRMQRGRPFESEADYHVYQCIKEIFEPFEGAHLSLASDQLSLAAMVRLVISHVGADDQVTDSENHDQGRN